MSEPTILKEEDISYFVSAIDSEIDKEEQKRLEKLVPYSEAKVFRTKKGFVIKDAQDEEWCKFVPFDDLDRVQTEVACRTLEPARIEAMDLMPLPMFTPVPEEFFREYERDFEKVCKESSSHHQQEGSTTVHINTLSFGDDMPNSQDPLDMSLTREDLMRSHFGSLAPFVDDYANNTFEIEENFTTHIPSLAQHNTGQSSIASPLSYQKALLKSDPIISEDFDIPRKPKTESLYCSAASVKGSDTEPEIEEDDDFPSSLVPSTYERKLLIEEDNEKRKKAGLPALAEKHPSDQEEFEDPLEEPEELDEWEILRNSLPPNLFLNGLAVTFVFITMIIGLFLQVSGAYLVGLFFILKHF